MLAFIETLNLINKECCTGTVKGSLFLSLGNDLLQLAHASRSGTDGNKLPPAGLRHDIRQCGFSDTGRTIENHRPEKISFYGPPQKAPFAENMLLTDVFGDGLRPHSYRKRRQPPVPSATKQFHGLHSCPKASGQQRLPKPSPRLAERKQYCLAFCLALGAWVVPLRTQPALHW